MICYARYIIRSYNEIASGPVQILKFTQVYNSLYISIYAYRDPESEMIY